MNETSETKYMVSDEEKWEHLPLISALSAMASLWHDMGKASDWFQEKLRKNVKCGDPLRHEWVSCMLLFAYIKSVDAKTDEDWLTAMSKGEFNEKKILQSFAEIKEPESFFDEALGFTVYLFVAWLILSHHRMPWSKSTREECRNLSLRPANALTGISSFFKRIIRAKFSYITAPDEDNKKTLFFSKGIYLFTESKWRKETSKWAERLFQNREKIEQAEKENSLYEIMMLSRSALVLGDHHQSALVGSAGKEEVLLANLINGKPNQTLLEHILGVEAFALKTAHLLPSLTRELPRAYDIKLLKGKSPAKFSWQDKARDAIKAAKTETDTERTGCFIINMASTGCGKTIANAKILHSLSDDESLRCSILLGLRTLTLQTGEEYRKRLGLSKEDLSIIVGSRAFVELSQMSASDTDDDKDEDESKPAGLGIDGVETDYSTSENLPIEEIITDTQALKMLYPPVLVSTIDQVIHASEDTTGAHNIVPILRIMSSDIVIDEVDDYSGDDLVAVGRLVYLCGVFGRKILLSSATIPPEEAEGLAAAYQRGWSEYAGLHGEKSRVLYLLCDEFSSTTFVLDSYKNPQKESIFREQLRNHLRAYTEKRIGRLERKGTPRRGEIVPVPERTQGAYFEAVINEMRTLHSRHKESDPKTSKNVSFGLVRFSNIKQCILFSRYLDENGLGDDMDIRFITYHAREVMLIRHTQEKYLDRILCRKNPGEIFEDSVVRQHIDSSKKSDIVFAVISSPVEELGRDHDFDWAVIEPASYRSIIQTSGRVLRHRESGNTVPNIGIMQYNWRALNSKDDEPCYSRPGFEDFSNILPSHDMASLVSEQELKKGITSIPRISLVDTTEAKDFMSLEHRHIEKLLGEKGSPQVKDYAAFYKTLVMFTALSQKIHPFRLSTGETREITLFNEKYGLTFKQNIGGKWDNVNQKDDSIEIRLEKSERDWINLDYETLVEEFERKTGLGKKTIQIRYGSLCYTRYRDGFEWIYSNKYGLEEKE